MITIRPVEETDLDAFYEHQADPEASAMAVFPMRERQVLLEHWHRNLAREDAVNRTIVVDGSVAGHVVSWESDGRRMLGYWIGREYWGRGVATAAVRALLTEIAERPLFAYVATSNIGSIRVLRRTASCAPRMSPRLGKTA